MSSLRTCCHLLEGYGTINSLRTCCHLLEGYGTIFSFFQVKLGKEINAREFLHQLLSESMTLSIITYELTILPEI